MRRIAIINQKGGVGKTTTAVNLAAGLAEAGKQVCVLDLDPQANATTNLGVAADGQAPSMYDVLIDGRPLAAVRRRVAERLWIAPSDINLAAAELELSSVVGRDLILRDAILADQEPFDFVLMDCPPSLGVLTLNALAAATEVFIALQPQFFPLHGMSKLLETTALVAKRINPALQVTGIVICMYEASAKLSTEVIGDLQSYLDKSRGQPLPWANACIFETRIRKNIKLAECPGHGQSIFQYAPGCPGAQDYAALTAEVLAQRPAVLAMRVTVTEEAAKGTAQPAAAAAARRAAPVRGTLETRPAPIKD